MSGADLSNGPRSWPVVEHEASRRLDIHLHTGTRIYRGPGIYDVKGSVLVLF